MSSLALRETPQPGWTDWRRHRSNGRQYRSLYDLSGSVVCYQWDSEDGHYTDRASSARLTPQQVREYERHAGVRTAPRTNPNAIQVPVRTNESDLVTTRNSLDPRSYEIALRDRHDDTSVVRATTRQNRHGPVTTIAGSPPSQLGRRPSDGRHPSGYNPQPQFFRTETAYFTSQAIFTQKHSSFFCLGRVFRTEWAEPEGTTSPIGTTDGVYRSRRPMVVVKVFDVHCICLPVFSYKAVGVAKSGLKQAEIEQHAILHTTDLDPEPTEGELRSGRDRLLRRPIAVEPEEGSTLATSSRIRFDMPLTFKHNLKVRNVGQVVEGHQQRLVYYWLQAMGAIQGR